MPKPSAADREDEVLQLVCAELSSGGRGLQIVDRPDRRAPSSVPPVDAIIRVAEDGYEEEWAADVCLISKKFDPRIPAAMRQLEAVLIGPLTELATNANRGLRINCCAYVKPDRVPRKEWAAMMSGYHRNIWDRAVMALTRSTGEWLDAEVSIMWSPLGQTPWDPRALMSYRDPFINESFSFSPKVRKKLEGQLSRAREAGYHTLLILDQEPPRSTPWIGDIIPTPYEIGESMAFAVAHCRTRLDAGILVNYSSVHEVYGRVGKPTPGCCIHRSS